MEAKAILNNLRIAPRKVRLVANLIKGMPTSQAQAQLKFLPKRSSEPILKLLNSAIANAKNFNLDENNLYISKIFVDSGQTMKRWLPRAFGRATPIMKRSSRITLFLNERIPSKIQKISGKGKKIKEEAGKKKELLIKEEELPAEEKKIVKTKEASRPKGASTISKKRFFSRQGTKRVFQRKSV